MRSLLLRAALAALALQVCACETAYVAHAHEVRDLVLEDRFGDAAAREARFGYDRGDRTLALLNEGALLHDAGQYRASNARLLEAEDRLSDFYKRSAGGELARSALSGASGDYLAEDYERILIYVFTAQNYLALGQRSDALVEARRLTGKLGVLADVRGHGRRYQGDGFAQWLAGLLYEDGGQPNDALISFQAALAAFPKDALAPELHQALCEDAVRAQREARMSVELPEGCDPKLQDAPGAQPLGSDGELVLLHAGGLVAERTERRLRCGFLATGPLWCDDDGSPAPSVPLAVVAVPALQPLQPQLVGATLEADNQVAHTGVVEDVTGIAVETLQDRMGEYRRQATTRALARLAASAGAGAGAAELSSKKLSSDQRAGVGALVGALTQVALSESEEADKRSWFALPAFYAMARLRLPAGKHRVLVRLRDASGQTVHVVDLGQVQVDPGRRRFLSVRSGR